MKKTKPVVEKFFSDILRSEPMKKVLQDAHDYAKQIGDPIVAFGYEKEFDKPMLLLAFTHSGKTLECNGVQIDIQRMCLTNRAA